MSRLEELEKAVDEAREELQKARGAWATYDADDYDADAAAYGDAVWAAYVDTHDTACEAYFKARQELKAYKKEHGI